MVQNQKEANLIRCLKTAIFMACCLLAFSAGAGRDSDQNSVKDNILSSEVRQISVQAIPGPVTDLVITVHSFNLPENRNQSGVNNKFDDDSRILDQLFLTLKKNRENFIPLAFRSYLTGVPANKDDLPDLS